MPDFEVKIRIADFFAISVLVFGYAFIAMPVYLKYKGFL
jgi:hypothetical protein